MSQFPKPTAMALRGRARTSNLNATMSAPGSPKAKTSRRTVASSSLSTSCTSTSAPSSLNVSVRSTSRSSSQSSRRNEKDPIRMAYTEYLIGRAMDIAIDVEGDKRAEELTKMLIPIEITDDETNVTLNEYEMKIKEIKAFNEAKIKFEEEINKIDCELESKEEAMEILERIHGKLQSMDNLIVKNIQIHGNDEEWDSLKGLMEDSEKVMDRMINNCKDFNLTLEIKENLDEFSNLFKAVVKQLQTIHPELELLEADAIIAMASKIK